MTHDPTKGCYTLDTLRALNPLYDHEHGLTQQDVEAVNAMKKYIESTRSADRPQCGDRVHISFARFQGTGWQPPC